MGWHRPIHAISVVPPGVARRVRRVPVVGDMKLTDVDCSWVIIKPIALRCKTNVSFVTSLYILPDVNGNKARTRSVNDGSELAPRF
jgi:hypothetical protein